MTERLFEMTSIGIDLGTSNSLVAYWTKYGPRIIPNAFGEHLTPSVISIDDNGEILVGQIAKERLITHPDVTISSFKRFMGTEKIFHLGKQSFNAAELSSFVLRSLKADAEAFLDEEVIEAVISVPAYFNDAQRKATKNAAEIAGLAVERLISEPTAAAISYGLHLEDADTKFLVFDLGGGTFDVSVLEFFEGVMEVKAVSGDNYLGGEDVTELLVAYFIGKNELDIEVLSSKEKSVIYKQAEACKRNLTTQHESKMTFEKNERKFDLTISRLDFEKIAANLILRLRNPIERALKDASISPKELDAVILIGGATRMPIIKSIISKMLGKLPFSQINPDEAVALGAAIQSALKKRDGALNELILTDVCPFTLGIETAREIGHQKSYESGYFSPIIERNSPIPISIVQRFYTISDNQKFIRAKIFQGESRKVENNLYLGELDIDVVPKPHHEEAVDVRFTYDINGILEVEVSSVTTDEVKSIVIENNPGKMTKEEIAARLEQLKSIKIHPRDRAENRLLLAKGERLFEESLAERRDEIGFQLDLFEKALNSQNPIDIEKATTVFQKFIDSSEQSRDF